MCVCAHAGAGPCARAGAIQSICFQEKGRARVRDLDGVPAMLRLLGECRGNVKVQTRCTPGPAP